MAHVVGVLTGSAGTKPFLYSDAEIIGLYSAIGGYVPGDPATDRGCDEQTALNYWENNGALPPHTTSPSGAHKIAGWMTVDSTNAEECRTALWLFENLYFGLELPDAWINPFPSAAGFTWDVAGPPDSQNGHCVVGVGYTAVGITIDTWGMTGLMTNAAVAKYPAPASHGETYTVVSMDAISKANEKAPNGFDWSQLVADLDSMGGNVSAFLRHDKSSTAGAQWRIARPARSRRRDKRAEMWAWLSERVPREERTHGGAGLPEMPGAACRRHISHHLY